ncbi:MAG TPA: hypothetical protein VIF62_35365 [Labilithrix sp.]
MAPLRRIRTPANDIETLEAKLDRASASDLVDVPAAVVCALCGDADCPGCEHEQSRSGIVQIVAWERSQAPALTRLWSTARSTTRDAEGFFELLPDGPILPALRFAATCELLASVAWLLLIVPVALVVAPHWLHDVAFDPSTRATALKAIVLGVPAFAGLLLLLHSTHGFSIDVGAAKNGARHARTRALRFGLYACGWDLVMSPIGAMVVGFKEGAGAAFDVLGLGNGLPTRATRAFLRGCYRLDGEPAKRAIGWSYGGAIVATTFGVIAILAAIIAIFVL